MTTNTNTNERNSKATILRPIFKTIGARDHLWRNESGSVRVSHWGGQFHVTVAQTIGGDITNDFDTRIEMLCWFERRLNIQLKFGRKVW